jgi:hypothetical protein
MNIQGQVWSYNGSIGNNNNYYIVQDNGKVPVLNKHEYSYLLCCINDGKRIPYLIHEPIPEHGLWRRIA